MSFAELFKDATHSIRMFVRSPGFTLAAVAALALGIGANTAIFSIVNAVLLKPVPFPEPDRLVVFQQTSPEGAFSAGSPAKFQFWREQTSVVQHVSAYRSNIVNLTGEGIPEQLRANQVSADYFRLFGASMLQGRGFTADEDRPGGELVAVLSHALWTRRFGSDPRIVGKTISLSGEPYTIIGIVGRRLRRLGVRAGTRRLYPIPARSAYHRPGPLLRGRRSPEARRLARTGAGAAGAGGRRVQAEVPERTPAWQRVLGPASERRARPGSASDAVAAARRGQLRASDRLRQCRQPAAGARHGAQARNRDSRRYRRRPRANRSTAAHRKRAAVVGGRRPRPCDRHARNSGAARDQHRRPAARWRGRRSRQPRLAGADLHAGRVDRDRRDLRPDSRAPRVAHRSQRHAQREQRPLRHWLPSEQDAIGARGRRGGAGAGAARGVGAARSDGGRAQDRRSRVRRHERAHDAHVDERPALREVAGRGRRGARRRGADQGAARRGRGERHVLRPARGRLRPAVHHRRTEAGTGPVPRRRRLADRVAGLLRGLPDPGEAGPDLQRSRYGALDAGRDHQRGDGAAVLAEEESAQRTADHRARRHARVRRRTGTPDHRRRQQRARRRPQQRSAADDVHPAGAGAGSL